MHGFERVFDRRVSFARAEMHLSKVTATEQPSDHELLLQIEQDHEPFHSIDPIVAYISLIIVEIHGFALGHDDEAVQILLSRVFEVVLFQPAILDIEYASLLRVAIALQTGKRELKY